MMVGFRYWVLGVGCWVLGFEYWVLGIEPVTEPVEVIGPV